MFKTIRKITLRPYDSIHAELVFDWLYSGEYAEFFRGIEDALTLSDVLRLPEIVRGQVFFIRHVDVETPIGMIIIANPNAKVGSIEVGAMVLKEFQNQNLAAASMVVLFDWLFNSMRIEKVISYTVSSNDRMAQILKKTGATLEGVFTNDAVVNGERVDVARHSLRADMARKFMAEWITNHGGE